METLVDKPKSDSHQRDVQAPLAGHAKRIEDLGRIILAYSDVTEKLQRSHVQLEQTVKSLQNELSEKNRQLARKQRMAALGEMAAGMAHEIRNPLGGIQLYASMLAQDLKNQPAPRHLVEKIAAGVKRLEALVGQVLQFTREIQAHPVEANLAEVVDQAIEMASDRLAPRGITCSAAGPRPAIVRIDPLLIGQAILNLLINAAEAIAGPGAIEIIWTQCDGPHWNLSVRDSGPGIPPGAMDQIFHPFFSTKETGTGLGLAIVHRIVEAHDGAITAANLPDRGAVFEIKV
ncbi:MAG: ATP-binding protein [Tepidisphaeraceae bacterium]|jgi:signal transduction histidine kinase